MYDDRPTITKSALASPAGRARPGTWWAVATVLLVAVLLVANKLSEPLQRLWWGSLGPLVVEDWQAGSSYSQTAGRSVLTSANVAPLPDAAVRTLVPVSLETSFHPVMFQIPAATLPLTFDDGRTRAFAGGSEPLHGTLSFANGVSYRFRLEESGDDSLLAVDLNANGDFSDDGPAYRSTTAGFEVTVALPMREVSGLDMPDGHYHLWIYRTPEGELRQVALTQLAGEVSLDGRPFTAYVVENSSIDGDYTNEGIYVDWNGDGRLHAGREYVAPGVPLELESGTYAFVVRD